MTSEQTLTFTINEAAYHSAVITMFCTSVAALLLFEFVVRAVDACFWFFRKRRDDVKPSDN